NERRIEGKTYPTAGGAALVEDTVSAADHCALVGQVSEADAWRKIIIVIHQQTAAQIIGLLRVACNARILRRYDLRRGGSGRIEVGDLVEPGLRDTQPLIAQAQAQRQPGVDLPVVLHPRHELIISVIGIEDVD